MDNIRSGFVAIVGKPNVGKSTLLNAILGEKIAIVSPKPQTTRNRITGIYTAPGVQLIFLDTPGLHRPKTKLGEYMVKTIKNSIADVDAAILVVEPKAEIKPAETDLIENLRASGVPTVLAVNKIDEIEEKTALMGVIGAWSERMDFAAVVPISAATRDGVDELIAEVRSRMPEGPQYYPDGIVTAEPERAVVAEIIREKLLLLLSDEVPHGTAVSVEKMRERANEEGGLMDIDAVIYCEKESHKGMIIGRGGSMLKRAGTLARVDIEKLLGCRVNLQLWVKVRDDWRNHGGMLRSLGYE